ncbi:MAG: hypothetical protein CMF74_03420 [Maricaulis sp.]|jgi:hypothetical protein|nr:hypothetical protein [Maricaulis sp.]HAQ36446.1 hypothetical protein [Alphaproteobacteria bacterium]|tara:strand:- start:235 stop:807 length:573 start_codon:yes stop_codon:yes gene_type:complete
MSYTDTMNLVLAAEFLDPSEALVLASALDAAGIPAFLPDHQFHTYFPFLVLGFSGARVLVHDSDFEAAREIVALDQRQGPLVPGPVCAGPTRKLKTRGGALALGALLALSFVWTIWVLVVPPRLMCSRICEACGYRYRPPRPDPITPTEARHAPGLQSAQPIARDGQAKLSRETIRTHLDRLIAGLRAIL